MHNQEKSLTTLAGSVGANWEKARLDAHGPGRLVWFGSLRCHAVYALGLPSEVACISETGQNCWVWFGGIAGENCEVGEGNARIV